MLKHIPGVIPPELMKIAMEMGHMDEILLADANFPCHSYGSERTKIVRMDGIGIPQLLEALLRLFPLDDFDPKPCTVCKPDDSTPRPQIWDEMNRIVNESEEGPKNTKGFDELERYSFYKRCHDTYCIVATGETALYSSIILKKGTIRPE